MHGLKKEPDFSWVGRTGKQLSSPSLSLALWHMLFCYIHHPFWYYVTYFF